MTTRTCDLCVCGRGSVGKLGSYLNLVKSFRKEYFFRGFFGLFSFRARNNFCIFLVIYSFFFFLLQYITTVIPYHPGNGPPSNPTVQVLIKSKPWPRKQRWTLFFFLLFLTSTSYSVFIVVLRAIVEDSPTVPTLLTDYILKGNKFQSLSVGGFFLTRLFFITVLCPT